MQHRMPELYAGLKRESTTFPVQYKGANVPQAWAAGSCFCLLQALVGFQPDAPAGKLYLDPALPDWLPDLRLKDLRLDAVEFDIRFWREKETTRWEVTRGDPSQVEVRAFACGPELWKTSAGPGAAAMSVAGPGSVRSRSSRSSSMPRQR